MTYIITTLLIIVLFMLIRLLLDNYKLYKLEQRLEQMQRLVTEMKTLAEEIDNNFVLYNDNTMDKFIQNIIDLIKEVE